MRVADLLEIDPAHVVACIHAERAKTEKEKKMWQRFATLTAGVSALLFMSLMVPAFSGSEYAITAFSTASNGYYVKSIMSYWLVFPPLMVLVIAAFTAIMTRKNIN